MKNKKHLVIGLTLVVIAVAALAVWFLSRNFDTKPTTINNPVTDNTVSDKNQPLTNGTPGNENKTLSPTSPATTTDSSSNLEKPIVTRAEVSNGYIRVSATLTQPSTGSCVLTLSKPGATTIIKTAPIIVGPSYYTCDGFRFPASEASGGTWTAVVAHRLNDKNTTSDSVNLIVP